MVKYFFLVTFLSFFSIVLSNAIDQKNNTCTKEKLLSKTDAAKSITKYPISAFSKNLKIGMVFSGQGSQYPGMGEDLYKRESMVRSFFQQASHYLGRDFAQLCFDSSENELRCSNAVQSAIFLISSAIFMLLHKKYKITPNIVAGHSLGNYAALFAAGSMTFSDVLSLLQKRSAIMGKACSEMPGGMILACGISREKIKKICCQYNNPANNTQVAEIACYNKIDQHVIAATPKELDILVKAIQNEGGIAKKLNVAGPFHSRLMAKAAKQFEQCLNKFNFKDLRIPLVNTNDVVLVKETKDLKNMLYKQITSPVYWWQSMNKYFNDCDVIIEIGPTLQGPKHDWNSKPIISVNNHSDIENLKKLLKKISTKKELNNREIM